jgi:hypothetical protein
MTGSLVCSCVRDMGSFPGLRVSGADGNQRKEQMFYVDQTLVSTAGFQRRLVQVFCSRHPGSDHESERSLPVPVRCSGYVLEGVPDLPGRPKTA